MRSVLVRFALWCFGLSLRGGVERIAKLWSASGTQRDRWITNILSRAPLQTGRGQTIASAEDLNAAPSTSKAEFRDLIARSVVSSRAVRRRTAGTTGIPTTIHLSKSDLARMLWVRDYCLSHCGLKLGDREGRLWGRPEAGLASVLKNWLMNRKVFCPYGPRAVDAVEELVKYQPDYIYGYASLIFEAAKIIQKYGIIPPPVRCVICTAESILPSQKRFISDQFNAPVREEYGSTEFDIIAFECDNGHMHLVNPWLVVSTDNGHALITDISRTTVSLVRYELGDSLQLAESDCTLLGSREIIASIEGRSIDRYAWVSIHKKFHAVEFAHAMNAYASLHAEVLGFTVTQLEYGIFKLKVDQMPKVGLDGIGLWIEKQVANEVGYDIEVVAEMATHNAVQPSGKRSYFIPMERPEQNLAD